MKILGSVAIVLAVGLAGCGEDGLMSKDAAMKLVSSAMEKAGSLKDMLGGITDGATAEKAKGKLATLVPSFLGAKEKVNAVPPAVQKLVGGKFGDVTKMFGTIKDKATSLMGNADIKSKLGDLLGKLTG